MWRSCVTGSSSGLAAGIRDSRDRVLCRKFSTSCQARVTSSAQQHSLVVAKLRGQAGAAAETPQPKAGGAATPPTSLRPTPQSAAAAPANGAAAAEAAAEIAELQTEVAALQAKAAEQQIKLKVAVAQQKTQAEAWQEQRAADAEHAKRAMQEMEEEAESVRSTLEFELLCGREELSAVRQRARQMVQDKDEELEVCRKLLQKEVEEQKKIEEEKAALDPVEALKARTAAEAAAAAAGLGEAAGGADASVVYSARLQSHRDVEVLRLQRECETLQTKLNEAIEKTSRLQGKNGELRRQLRRTESTAAAGFVKDLVLKYAPPRPPPLASVPPPKAPPRSRAPAPPPPHPPPP